MKLACPWLTISLVRGASPATWTRKRAHTVVPGLRRPPVVSDALMPSRKTIRPASGSNSARPSPIASDCVTNAPQAPVVVGTGVTARLPGT